MYDLLEMFTKIIGTVMNNKCGKLVVITLGIKLMKYK